MRITPKVNPPPKMRIAFQFKSFTSLPLRTKLFSNIAGTKRRNAAIIATIVILTLTQLLRRFLASTIIRGLEKLASRSRTSLDDELLEVFKPSVIW